MKSFTFHKAEGTPNSLVIENVTIAICEKIPDFPTAELQGAFYDAEANALVDALLTCLPQATLHRVTGELMRRCSTLYRGSL